MNGFQIHVVKGTKSKKNEVEKEGLILFVTQNKNVV